ncbi:MAG: DNA translocase FtsK 4TM domain-containing protein [Smithellaceae bacterium]|nr:DNA translocase FtsK 4TM domain-containing protein [Smithellaceae bacterium]
MEETSSHHQSARFREIKGVLCFALSLFLFLCLFSFSPEDPSPIKFIGDPSSTRNWMGIVGSHTAGWMIFLTGLSSFLLPTAFLALAFQFFRRPDFTLKAPRALGFLFLTLFLAALSDALIRGGVTVRGATFPAGGILGAGLVRFLQGYFNPAGTFILLIVSAVVSLFFTVDFSLVSTTEKFLRAVRGGLAAFKDRLISFFTGCFAKAKAEKNPPPVIEDTGMKAPPKKAKTKKVEQTHFNFSKLLSDSAFHLPPFSLLSEPPQKDARVKRDHLITNSRILEKKLADFGVEGRVVEVLPGPVITMYELEPAPGVKINRITSLTDDLALALMAPSIRILAPIPGKSVIGIEIPNLKREPVFLKDVLDNDAFTESSLRLPIALGVDFVGAPVIADLARMPHLLIAGTTGSGKSVALNAMICSILFKAPPDDIKFLMVDPKRLELSSYEGIPHLMHPVVVDPKKASQVLRWTVEEMERRYRIISDLGVKSIDAYNEAIITRGKTKMAPRSDGGPDENAAGSDTPFQHVKLPYIVIVIDELADLMMVAPRDVEESLTRLAQMARAAGIHLILATQRPSVDVITGLIKANFPTRISFKVSSKIDSRTIIDQPGAEQLLGAGDMLFIPPGTSKLTRIHGAYLSDAEISRIVEFIKMQAQPTYDDSIEKFELESAQTRQDEDGYDEKYDEAVALVGELGQASISLVQRYMKIGYNRAARMIEQMEREGIVGPSDGAKPRKVLIRKLPQ